MGALALGVVAGVVCFLFCTGVKSALGYDDSLDVFGVHCIGGIIGALGTGLLVNPHLGGTGVADYVSRPGEAVATYEMSTQMVAQCKAVLLTLVWSGVGSAIIYLVARPHDRPASDLRERACRPRPHRARRARLQRSMSLHTQTSTRETGSSRPPASRVDDEPSLRWAPA